MTEIPEPDQVVAAYMVAWNESHPEARRALLEICWADDGVYTDPGVHLVGRDALSARILEKQIERPGAKLKQLSVVDHHHGWFRFHWQLIKADGSKGPESIDIGQVGPDGRIVRMIGFFGPLANDLWP